MGIEKTDKETSNLPAPKSAADKLALLGSECLDQDEWSELDEYYITIRSVRYWIANESFGVKIATGPLRTRVGSAVPSAPYRELFWDSFTRFTKRETKRLAEAKLAAMQKKSEPKRSWWRFGS